MKIPKKIGDVSIKWFYQSPFLSEFLLRTTYKENNSIPTMGVGFEHNNLTIYYNTDFLESLPPAQIEGILVHEILHILTLTTFTDRRASNKDKKRWNIASDIVINEEILTTFTIRNEKLELPEWACFLKNIRKEGYEGKVITEDIYDWMEKNDKESSDYKTVDVHDFLESLTEEQKMKVKQIIESAKRRSYGNISGSFESFLKKLLRPKGIPLQQLLRNAVQEQMFGKNKIEYNWGAKNRRGQDILPGKKYFSNRLNIVFDTSGSCYEEKMMTMFFSEIDRIAESIEEIFLIQFDTEVKNVSKYKKGVWKKIKLYGGGGTDIQPVFSYLQEKKLNKFPTIIFTDGEFNWDLKTYNLKPLWVLSQECDIKFGRKIILKNME